MDKKKLKTIVLAVAIAFAVVSLILMITTIALIANSVNALIWVILGVVSLLSAALAAELAYLFILNNDSKANYFLYDSASKKNVPIQKLNFGVVNGRMNRYLSKIAQSEGKIWNERVLDNPYVEIGEEFKPLVAYKLLFSLAEKDAEAGWRCLENASSETIAYICSALNANNEYEFTSNFSAMMAEKPLNINLVRDYLIRNKKYMQGRMLKYVVDNIDKF